MLIELERFDSERQCDALIEEFCFKESEELFSADTRKRKSVLLQILADIGYCVGYPGVFKNMQLTHEQGEILSKGLAPLLAPAILYCTAIDLMARVFNKRLPAPNETQRFFKTSADKFFSFDVCQTDALWKFRTGIVHQYSITEFVVNRFGSKDEIVRIMGSGIKIISTRPMFSSLESAIKIFSKHLKQEAPALKKQTCCFIEEHGFIYYLID